MTLVAVGVVIGPLVRPTKINSALSGNELEIHKNQLEDIDRDLELRLITSAEADIARVEIHRRILSSYTNQRALKRTSRRKIILVAIIISLCVPTTSLIIYLQIGRPDLAIEPNTSEHMMAGAGQDNKHLARRVSELARSLEEDPGQVKVWAQLGEILFRIGHFERAAVAYLQANTLAPSAPEHMSRAGEALAFAADGTVTPRAEKLFTKALRHNPLDARAQYYIGLANFQRGNFQAALKLWVVLEATLENKTPRRQFIQKRINKLAKRLSVDIQRLATLRDQARQNLNTNR